MNIIRCDDNTSLTNIVESKAKYQKVMLIYGDTISQSYLDNICNEIKNICIFNKNTINKIEEDELNNGYKLIIWICTADEFLKVDISRSEFINVYLPQDNYFLPFFANNVCNIKRVDDFLIIKGNTIDTTIKSSFYLNNFYKYLLDVLAVNENEFESIFQKDITTKTVVSELQSCLENCKMLDLEILKKQNISCEFLPLIDLILVDAFLILISSIKSNKLTMVDIYKSVKGEEMLIDKFYAMSNNKTLINLIILNYHCLYNACLKSKEKILDSFNISKPVLREDVENIIDKVKNFCKYSLNIECCLYIFNLFSL